MKPRWRQCGLLLGVLFGANALAADGSPGAVAKTEEPPSLWSKDDGWPDISGFIDQAYGFVPLLIPITEPAVGFGAAGALVFIDKPKAEANAGFGRPNISVVGALGTENGTRGEFAGAGATRNEGGPSRAAQEVRTHGIGFRYEIARKYGLHMGVDVAQGPDGPAWYVQFGSAWLRP